MANSGFQNEIENMIDDIVAEDKKRIALAFEQIKKKTESKIREAIKIAMIDNYYNGYDPLKYNRTGQLRNAVAPLILDDSDNSGLQFSFGIKTSPPKGSAAMRHDKLTVKVTKKNGEVNFHTYNVKDYNPEIEKWIFNNFMNGVHPNANERGITETPTTNVYTAINKALDDLLKDGIIDKIIQDAFSQ
jgi:hypothetical protein